MKTKTIKKTNILCFGILMSFITFAQMAKAVTITVTSSRLWSQITPTPTTNDVVSINPTVTVTVNVATAVCGGVVINNSAANSSSTSTLRFNSGSKLTVSGAVTMGSVSSHTRNGNIDMTNGGILTLNSLSNTSGTSTFTAGAGKLKINASSTLPVFDYNDLEIIGGTTTLSGETSVEDTLIIDNGTTLAGGIHDFHIIAVGYINGTLSGTGTIEMHGIRLAGTGAITNTHGLLFDFGATSILAGSNLTVAAPITIDVSSNVTNNASFTSTSTSGIAGTDGTSVWTNTANSSLTVAGSLLSTGTLTASASGNTITYNTANNANVKTATYYNLTINAVSATKTLSGDITVNNDLSYLSGFFNANAHNITVQGDIIPGGTFTPGAGTVTVNGNTAQAIGGTFSNLIIANTSGGVSLNLASSVSATLTMTSGMLTLGNYKLTIASTGTITGIFSNTKFIQTNGSGMLERTTSNTAPGTLFPIGYGGYNPIYVKANVSVFDASVNSTLTDKYGNTITQQAVNADWKLIRISGVSNDAVVTPQWNMSSPNDELASFNRASSYVAYRTSTVGNSAGAVWTNSTSTGAATAGTITNSFNRTSATISMTANTTFYVGVGDGVSALPVTMVSFNANYENNEVNLNWATASEINNHFFNIERSVDGENWQTIGQVQGHGNSLTAQNYFATDNLAGIVPAGDIYYRLKQVDFNGESTYSEIRSVTINHTTVAEVTTYPNPTVNLLNVSWTNETNNASLKLVNIAGATVYSENVTGTGMMHKQIDMTIYPTGTYFLQIATDKNINTQKVIKN